MVKYRKTYRNKSSIGKVAYFKDIHGLAVDFSESVPYRLGNLVTEVSSQALSGLIES
jgi:hypothetical protein